MVTSQENIISRQIMENSQKSRTESVTRQNSGSWNGVDESEDEIAHRCNDKQSLGRETSPLLQSHTSSSYGSNASNLNASHRCENFEEQKLRRKLKFFFMNPMEKWHAKRRFPWKLLIQIIKIIICTVQLGTFASQRYDHVTYLWDTKISFSHLFIKSWDASREISSYPPSTGPLALYKVDDFYDFLDYTLKQFANISEVSIGSYSYDKLDGEIVMPKICLFEYGFKPSLINNRSKKAFVYQRCANISTSAMNDSSNWSSRRFFETNNMTINFNFLLHATFSFILKTFKLEASSFFEGPECYNMRTSILFDNSDHDGQMLVDLEIGAEVLDCPFPLPDLDLNQMLTTHHSEPDFTALNSTQTALNLVTIIVCLLSLFMCLRAILRAQMLRKKVDEFFVERYKRKLTHRENFEFVNLWYVLICINDVLIVVGSIIKIGLESEDYEGYLDKWNVCSLLLGVGNLFIWCGCLRYLGFFETYNVLILTLKSCFPNILRYSIGILMVFAGYALCGWLVLSPYNLKFRSLSSTAECLFSLVNGDDMFATFVSMTGRDQLVWWFSRVYLYSFVALFIYVILSLFIAIIMDAYETIKRCYEHGFPLTDLRKFANECTEDPWSGVFHDGEQTIQDLVYKICCCWNRRASNTVQVPVTA